MKEFNYYIYIDYSENLVGYIIIKKNKLKELLPKISKLHHYRNIKHKKSYISTMKRKFRKEKIKDLLLRCKIKKVRLNLNIFADIVEFVKKQGNYTIFISVDDNQYPAFFKLLRMITHRKNLVIKKESELKKDSLEHRLSLIIDTMLNIERRKLK